MCPVCGKDTNHYCQDELAGGILNGARPFLVDTFALARGDRPEAVPSPEEYARQLKQERDLRSIRALQGAPLEGCGGDDCDDCYPK